MRDRLAPHFDLIHGDAGAPKAVRLFGLRVDPLSLADSVVRAEELIEERRPAHHVCINAAKVVSMRTDETLRGVLAHADMVNVDGQSVVWASKLLRAPVPERVAGIDFMEALIERAAVKQWPVYFLGASEKALQACVDHFRAEHPDLVVAGQRNGFWSADEEADVIAGIKESGARVVFIAMPTPRKEYLVGQRLAEFGDALVVGVGGSFDVFAGLVSRAPAWAQRWGLEWAHRLAKEPRRMWKRYLVGNTKFLMVLFATWLQVRVRPLVHAYDTVVAPETEGFHDFSRLSEIAKRSVDFVGAVAGLVLLAPFAIAIALGIRVLDGKHVMFRQVRVGKDGREFTMYKFRTMQLNAEDVRHELAEQNEADGLLFKVKDDPRITRLGRILRPLGLDELPQLINVLKGDMSLVGPRPALPSEVAKYSDVVRNRLRVKPGMTGLWQIRGRHELTFEEYVRYDLHYVHHCSLWMDFWVILATVPALARRRGAH